MCAWRKGRATVSGKRTKVLVVDDNPVIVEMLQRKLGKEGYQVLGCVDSTQVADLCAEEAPDIVVLDILMPSKSGWEVMEELKSNPRTESIPVIISTVKNRPEDVDMGRELKAADYIAKPYVVGDLVEKIEGLLGGKEAQ